MGVDLKPLIVPLPISITDLKSKSVAIDAFNTIYQFLATIRGPTGEYLSNDKGEVTSHLSGVFYRNINLLIEGVNVIYIFDGKPNVLKRKEIERRKQIKIEASQKYERALDEGNLEDAKKFSQATSILTSEMVNEVKYLLSLLGIPVIQAPSEGEALAAYLTRCNKVHAAASQDYDSILFGAKKLIRNFAISGRRKMPNRNMYVDKEPEFIELEKVLEHNKLTHEQLVDIGILIGTDFNIGGFEGIGPKTAVKLIREYGKLENIKRIQDTLSSIPYEEIREIFLNPNISEIPDSSFKSDGPQYDGIVKFLCDEKGFSNERVNSLIQKLKISLSDQNHSLEKWF